ncbi:MAG TPA: M15 family metallopeptidase [Myxococcota bacterium]|nr:M15 family metallopeptidase [Myxococcota bacterium]
MRRARSLVALGSILVALAALAAAGATTPADSLRAVLADPEYVDVSGLAGVAVDLRYAGTNNFMHTNVYGPFARPFLRKPAAEKLRLAAAALLAERPGWKLVILDALRPRSVQRLFWARVVGTPQQPYVADPEQGSVHNFGFALDVTLQDDTGAQIDMGTGFDDFTALAEPQREAELAKAGKLSAKQLENRRLLRRIMTGAGFSQRPNEWWHYDALPLDDARASHSILE